MKFRLRYAWYCFIDLLDADYASGFICPQCGDNPDTVVMDGVTLGIRKSFMPWKDHMSRKPQTLDGRSVLWWRLTDMAISKVTVRISL